MQMKRTVTAPRRSAGVNAPATFGLRWTDFGTSATAMAFLFSTFLPQVMFTPSEHGVGGWNFPVPFGEPLWVRFDLILSRIEDSKYLSWHRYRAIYLQSISHPRLFNPSL